MSLLAPITYLTRFSCPKSEFHSLLCGKNYFKIKEIVLELREVLYANHDNLILSVKSTQKWIMFAIRFSVATLTECSAKVKKHRVI